MSRHRKVKAKPVAATKRATAAIAAPIVVNGVDVVPLRQASRLLYLIAEVGRHGDIGDDGDQLIEAIKLARILVDGVFNALSRGAK